MNINQQKKQKYQFIFFYFLSYLSFGIVMSNFTPFLSNLGYDTMQRGVLLSSYAFTTIIFQLLFGVFTDRYQTIKKIVILSITVFALSSFVLFSQTGMWFSMHLMLVALSGGLLNTLCGLYDTWVLSTSQYLYHLSFIKAFGSIGWAIGSVLASYLLILFSYQGMAISICFIMVLSIINIRMIPDMNKVERKNKTTIKEVMSLMKDHTYMLLILILFLLYSMVVANNCTVIDKMLSLGATQGEISLKWSMQSLLEIPTYILGTRILLRFSHVRLLQFSAIMLIFQFLLFGMASTIPIMILCCVFQLFSTPILMITSKSLIFQMSKPELRGSSQLVALSIFTGLSSLCIPVVAGSLILAIGIDSVLYAIAGLGVIALILSLILEKILRYQKIQKTVF